MKDQFSINIGNLFVAIRLGGRWGNLPANFSLMRSIKNDGVVGDMGLGSWWCLWSWLLPELSDKSKPTELKK